MKIPLTEVLVPRELTWWTYFGLRSHPDGEWGQIHFVSTPTAQADNVIVDLRLVRPLLPWISPREKVIVLLWNGYESFLECSQEILALCNNTERLEIMVVGDLWPMDDSLPHPPRIVHLFAQNLDLYRWPRLQTGTVGAFRCSLDYTVFWIKCRTLLVSGKVLLRLSITGRIREYLGKRYVFCGQSGLQTLKKYAKCYGISEQTDTISEDGLGCKDAFILKWCEVLQHSERDWSWRVTARAFLRLIALRALLKARGDALFLHLLPKRNLNVYQAGLLFRNHVFLEFGGIHGDEPVYPRTADLAILGRKVLKFDTLAALERLRHLGFCDQKRHARFVREYEEEVIARFDAYPLEPVQESCGRPVG